jgi:methyltransferase
VRSVVLLGLGYGLAMRVAEMLLSRRNTGRTLARGGRAVQADGFGALALVHAGWFVAMAAEEALLGATALPTSVRVAALTLFVLSELTRLWCIATLGDRWNVRVIVLPDEPRVRRGPYRFLSHPNYVTAAVGLVTLPLALGLPWTAVIFLPLKLLAVRRRIRIEEPALSAKT